MLNITLQDCGKSYNRKWLFRHLDISLSSGDTWAFLGANGSGKSTLSLMLSSQVWPVEGSITWELNGKSIPPEHVFSICALASPAMELPGEYNLKELVSLHGRAKPFKSGYGLEQMMELCGFDARTSQKPLISFSSGMLQRVKLALAAFSDTPLLILDEPLTNLDKAGEKVYTSILEQHTAGRLLVVASNREDEYRYCNRSLRIRPDASVALNEEFLHSP